MATEQKQLLKASGRDGELRHTIERLGAQEVKILQAVEDSEGRNVLHRAAEAGALDNVRYLIDELAFPVSLRDAKYKTPIMYAVKYPDVLRVLLAAGASPAEFKANSWTPLHYAAKVGLTVSLQQLLDAGASASVRNKEGASPVYVAAREGHLAAVRCLLASAPPPVTVHAHTGQAAAAAGSVQGGVNAPAYIELEVPVDTATRIGALVTQGTLRGRTSLHAAVLGGHSQVLRALLQGLEEAGFDPLDTLLEEIVDASGQSLQHEAAEAGSLACAKVLAEQGGLRAWPPQVNPDVAGRLPIHAACLNGHADVLQWLLETVPEAAEGGPAFVDGGGCTALYHACSAGATACVDVLLAAGSDALDGNVRRSAVHIAAVNGHTEAVQACIASLTHMGLTLGEIRAFQDAEGFALEDSMSIGLRQALGWAA